MLLCKLSIKFKCDCLVMANMKQDFLIQGRGQSFPINFLPLFDVWNLHKASTKGIDITLKILTSFLALG